MVASKAGTVSEYLKSLPPERRGAREGGSTYNKQPRALAALASQKGYCSLYLMSIYSDSARKSWFEGAFAKAGKKLDMGKRSAKR